MLLLLDHAPLLLRMCVRNLSMQARSEDPWLRIWRRNDVILQSCLWLNNKHQQQAMLQVPQDAYRQDHVTAETKHSFRSTREDMRDVMERC